MKKKLKLYVSYERTGRKVKHRIICNISLAVVLGYRIYLILNSTQYESFYSGTYSGKIGTELLFRFLWQWLPFIVIAVGFLANFFKHPVDIAINGLCIGFSMFSFFCEGFLYITDLFDGYTHDFVKPSINIFIVIISVVSIVFSAREYEKKKKAGLLNNKNT